MSSPRPKGTCAYCDAKFSRSGMSRHLSNCAKRQEVIRQAEAQMGATETLYQLRVQGKYNNDYWLDLEVRSSAELGDLDDYLRSIWLECCHHLSSFGKGLGNEIDMDRKIGSILRPGDEIIHQYDFGSTTTTLVRCVGSRQGKPTTSRPLALMARNDQPVWECGDCEEPATLWCDECAEEYGFELGMLCPDHVKECPHESHSHMPLVNSPRWGVCGYNGPAKAPY